MLLLVIRLLRDLLRWSLPATRVLLVFCLCAKFLPAQTAPAGWTQTSLGTDLFQPIMIAVDEGGSVYISDTGNNRVVREAPQPDGSYKQTLVAGGLAQPTGVAVDGSGNVFICETSNNRVLKESLQPDGTYKVTTVGSGLFLPIGVAVDGNGNIYVADTFNNRVLKESPQPDGGYTQTTIGSGMSWPIGIAIGENGDLYFADYNNNRVLKESLSNGSYTQTELFNGLNSPIGVATDKSGNIYISYVGSNTFILKEIKQANGDYIQSTVGSGMLNPYGVTVDGNGSIYISDFGHARVLKLNVAGIQQAQKDFTLSASAVATQPINPGDQITYSLSATPAAGGFSAPLTLNVTGLPPGASATFDPSSLPANATGGTIHLTVQTATRQTTALAHESASALALALLLFPLLGTRRMRHLCRPGLLALVMFTGTIIALTGCGISLIPPKEYTLTVAATSGSIQHTVQLKLQVR